MASELGGSVVGWERRNSWEGGLLKNHQQHHNPKDEVKAAWWCSWPKKAAGLRRWKGASTSTANDSRVGG